MVFLFHSWCLGLFEIEVIEAGIFFTETSDYFSEILWSSCRPCSQIWHLYVTYAEGLFTNCDIWLVSTCVAGNGRSFRNTWFHSLWGVHDFTHSLYMHYIICQSKDYVYGLMTLVCLPGLVWLLCLGLICLSHLTGLEYSFSKVARIFFLKEHR